jgi:S1-C subfamily serine protease
MSLRLGRTLGGYHLVLLCACVPTTCGCSRSPREPNAAQEVIKEQSSKDKTRLEKAATVRDVLRVVADSIVQIEVDWTRSQSNRKSGPSDNHAAKLPAPQLGTGFIFDKRGYVLTNSHIVTPPEGWFLDLPTKVFQQDSRTHRANPPEGWVGLGPQLVVGLPIVRALTVHPTRLVGVDQRSDLAVLKLEETWLHLPALPFDFDHGVGDDVLAVGFARGESPDQSGEATVTKGIISAIGRSTDDGAFSGMIQTDAALNSGNSGGPLLNMRGKVIGVNTSGFASAASLRELFTQRSRVDLDIVQGIFFAQNSRTASDFANMMITEGKVRRASLGLKEVAWVTFVQKYGESRLSRESGLIILEFERDSPAVKAGLMKYDIILMLSDHGGYYNRIHSLGNLNNHLAFIKPGEKVKVDVIRYYPDTFNDFRVDEPRIPAGARRDEKGSGSKEIVTIPEPE